MGNTEQDGAPGRALWQDLQYSAREAAARVRGGGRQIARWLLDRAADRYWDWRHGIRTSKRRSIAQLGLDIPEAIHYQPISYADFGHVMRLIGTPTNNHVFLDLGCGKGRAVCLAALHPFRAIIGVEVSRELCDIARANVERLASRLVCRDISIVLNDAASYEIPADVTHIYLFNPFVGKLLSGVIDNIERSLSVQPRELRLIYYGSVLSQEFRHAASKRSWLEPVSETVLPTGRIALVYDAATSFFTTANRPAAARERSPLSE